MISRTGAIVLSSQVGIVDWGLSTAATTFTATSGMGGIDAGTVTSGGTLTLQAAGPITLTRLVSTGGDVDMTSTASTITGGTVDAYGSDHFAAYGNNIGQNVISRTGAIDLSSQVGIVDWGLVAAATSVTATGGSGVVIGNGTSGSAFTVTGGGSGIGVGTISSGGPLTLQSQGNTDFGSLSSGGAVTVSSSAGTVSGQSGGSISSGGPIDVSGQTVDLGGTSTSEPIRVSGGAGQGFDPTLQSSFGGTTYALDVDLLTRVGDDTLTSHIDDVEVAVWEFPVMEYERHLSRARRIASGDLPRNAMVNLQGSYEPDAFTVVLKRKK